MLRKGAPAAGLLAVVVALSACASPTATPLPAASPLSTMPAADAAGCPAAGTVLDVAGYLALDARCFDNGPVRVAGWLTPVYPGEYASATSAVRALRAGLPGADVHRTTTGYGEPGNPVVYLAFQNALMSNVRLPVVGQWVDLGLRPEGQEGVQECGWEMPEEWGAMESVCLPLALVSTAATPPAPAAALAGCPPIDAALPASWFSALPRPCFGAAGVNLSGWLRMGNDGNGGQTVPWIEPYWLAPRVGGIEIAPDSTAPSDWSVVAHFAPGHAEPSQPALDRWVTVRGHYAVTESAECRYVYPGGYDPVASGSMLDDAGARAECASAFIVEDISAGAPGSN